jgi:hypothetical protein
VKSYSQDCHSRASGLSCKKIHLHQRDPTNASLNISTQARGAIIAFAMSRKAHDRNTDLEVDGPRLYLTEIQRPAVIRRSREPILRRLLNLEVYSRDSRDGTRRPTTHYRHLKSCPASLRCASSFPPEIWDSELGGNGQPLEDSTPNLPTLVADRVVVVASNPCFCLVFHGMDVSREWHS